MKARAATCGDLQQQHAEQHARQRGRRLLRWPRLSSGLPDATGGRPVRC